MRTCFVFSSFFGGGFGFNFGGNQEAHREIPRGGTITMEMQVSLEDLYTGNFIEVTKSQLKCFRLSCMIEECDWHRRRIIAYYIIVVSECTFSMYVLCVCVCVRCCTVFVYFICV